MRKRLLIMVALSIAALAGCKGEDIKPILDNLSKDCDRHYTFSLSSGGVGGVGASGTVAGTMDCKHEYSPPAAPVVTPIPGGSGPPPLDP